MLKVHHWRILKTTSPTLSLTCYLRGWSRSGRKKDISRFFVGQVAGLIIGGIERTIKVGLPKEQVEVHLDEFVVFLYYGFKTKEGE